jgi:hypothetical protein
MILALELRRAERAFRKRGQHNLAKSAHVLRGALADHAFRPNFQLEDNCRNLINLAFGGPIRA